jgi:hypothetical protein
MTAWERQIASQAAFRFRASVSAEVYLRMSLRSLGYCVYASRRKNDRVQNKFASKKFILIFNNDI